MEKIRLKKVKPKSGCQVYVRIRPLLPFEKKGGFVNKQLAKFDAKSVTIADSRSAKQQVYTCFQRIVGPEAT